MTFVDNLGCSTYQEILNAIQIDNADHHVEFRFRLSDDESSLRILSVRRQPSRGRIDEKRIATIRKRIEDRDVSILWRVIVVNSSDTDVFRSTITYPLKGVLDGPVLTANTWLIMLQNEIDKVKRLKAEGRNITF